jgi:hypothetical protein
LALKRDAMTRPIEPQLERLISRHLDGQMPEERRATFYRELLKNPEARQTLEDYEANDRMAAEALAELIPPVTHETVPDLDREVPDLAFAARGYRTVFRGSFHAWAAIAAAVAFMAGGVLVAWSLSGPHGGAQRVAQNPQRNRDAADTGDGRLAGLPSPGVENRGQLTPTALAADHGPIILIDNPVSSQRPAEQGFIGLFDQRDNRLYLMEVPHDASGQAASLGDI